MNRLSPNGAAFIRLHEGFRSKWYKDPTGTPTIGIGFTWASSAFKDWWRKNRPGETFGPGSTMTRAEAEQVLIAICDAEYGKAVDKFLGKKVPAHVFDAMASAVFNLGPGALKWKWAAAAKAGDYAEAARLLRKTGTTSKGKTLAGLVRRRKEEALLLEKGIYTGVDTPAAESGILVSDAMADGVLRRGESGPAVAQLIRDLAALGHYDGVLDDIYGYGTEAAVLAFQREYDLTADGIAGPKALEAIKTALWAKQLVSAPSAQENSERAQAAKSGGSWADFGEALAAFLERLLKKGK